MNGSGRVGRVRGALLGSVVGDAFGSILEGSLPRDVVVRAPQRAAQEQPWHYTDDGAMAIAVAESLVETKTVDPEHLLGRFAARYEPARGFGRGMKLATRAFTNGVPWQDCAFAGWSEGSRGNGGAVRIAAVAVASWPDDAAWELAIRLATRVTHAHEEAISLSLVQAAALSTLVDDPETADDPLSFLALIRSRVAGAATAETALDRVADLIAAHPSPEVAAKILGTSTLAIESVPAALRSFLEHRSPFDKAVIEAAQLGGDVDSICSMVGALAGARLGDAAIPDTWLNNLQTDAPSPKEMLLLGDRLTACRFSIPIIYPGVSL